MINIFLIGNESFHLIEKIKISDKQLIIYCHNIYQRRINYHKKYNLMLNINSSKILIDETHKSMLLLIFAILSVS